MARFGVPLVLLSAPVTPAATSRSEQHRSRRAAAEATQAT